MLWLGLLEALFELVLECCASYVTVWVQGCVKQITAVVNVVCAMLQVEMSMFDVAKHRLKMSQGVWGREWVGQTPLLVMTSLP